LPESSRTRPESPATHRDHFVIILARPQGYMAGALARAGNSPDSMHGTGALASEGIGPASHEADDRKGKKMANDRLRAKVAAELGWDPKVDSTDITVSAEGGMVTLHGAVASCRQKREADNAARRVYGVTGISNYLEVHIPGRDRRADADVRADVRQALLLNCLIPATVQARVEAGLVTLSGVAAWQFQRDEAELACVAVPGVTGVDVAISLHPALSDGDIQQAISAAFARSARLDRFELSVDNPLPGLVVLSGTVSSWAEHDAAVAVAWSAPGITDVDDRIVVAY
jgi:osmotically-inducible protein OsmY